MTRKKSDMNYETANSHFNLEKTINEAKDKEYYEIIILFNDKIKHAKNFYENSNFTSKDVEYLIYNYYKELGEIGFFINYGGCENNIKEELLIKIKPILRNLYNKGIIKDKIIQSVDIFSD